MSNNHSFAQSAKRIARYCLDLVADFALRRSLEPLRTHSLMPVLLPVVSEPVAMFVSVFVIGLVCIPILRFRDSQTPCGFLRCWIETSLGPALTSVLMPLLKPLLTPLLACIIPASLAPLLSGVLISLGCGLLAAGLLRAIRRWWQWCHR